MELKIKNLKGDVVVAFSNFRRKFENDANDPKILSFKISINVDCFCANSEIEAEKLDFEYFENELRTLIIKKNGTFFFQHLDNRIKIKFQTYADKIYIYGEFNNQDYTSKLTFDFISDFKFLNELLLNLNELNK